MLLHSNMRILYLMKTNLDILNSRRVKRPLHSRANKGLLYQPYPLLFCLVLKSLERKEGVDLDFVCLKLASGQGAFLFPVSILFLPAFVQ